MQTLKDSDLSELATDLADSILLDGVVGNIPILGTLHKLYKAAGGVSQLLFTKKLVRFLCELKDVAPDERRTQIEQLGTDAKHTEETGEMILLYLERANDMRKPAMMGRTFRAYVQGKIDYSQLRYLYYTIDVLNTADISTLLNFYRNDTITRFFDLWHFQHLIVCDLATLGFKGRRTVSAADSETTYYGEGLDGGELVATQNDFGRLFIDVAIGDSAREYD